MPKFKVVATLKRSDYPLEIEQTMFSKVNCDFLAYVAHDEETTLKYCKDAHIILTPVGGGVFSGNVLEELERCLAIVRYGIGIDGIDIKKATDLGIVVCNVPDFCIEEVSTHTLMLILACWRKLFQLCDRVKKELWSYHPYRPIYRLEGKTLGLVSFGKIARAVASKAKAFGLKVIAYDPYVLEDEIKKYDVIPVSLKKLLQISDIVSIHAPATEETYHMIGETELRLMKPTAILINTSRGCVIDEDALYKALSEKWIAAAGLDVLEREPPSFFNPLVKMENVIVTPHCAFYSEESIYDLHKRVAEMTLELMNGHLPTYVVNSEVKEKARLFKEVKYGQA